MSLSIDQKEEITNLLRKKLDEKLKHYLRESSSMPFLVRLIQDSEQVAAYSFIQSINTTLGMSIYEGVSKLIAGDNAEECFTKYDLGGVISNEQRLVIGEIVRKLRNKEKTANNDEETKLVLSVSAANGSVQKEGRVADLYMLREGQEHYFEIKTPKPNIDVFTKTKTKLLEWVARRRRPVGVFLALPYNPYHPRPYKRFTEQGIFDRKKELLIGEEYWDFLGGERTFSDLLQLFDKIGKEFKETIQQKIKEVAKKKMEF